MAGIEAGIGILPAAFKKRTQRAQNTSNKGIPQKNHSMTFGGWLKLEDTNPSFHFRDSQRVRLIPHQPTLSALFWGLCAGNGRGVASAATLCLEFRATDTFQHHTRHTGVLQVPTLPEQPKQRRNHPNVSRVWHTNVVTAIHCSKPREAVSQTPTTLQARYLETYTFGGLGPCCLRGFRDW